MIRSLKIYEFFVTIALKLDDNPLPGGACPGCFELLLTFAG